MEVGKVWESLHETLNTFVKWMDARRFVFEKENGLS